MNTFFHYLIILLIFWIILPLSSQTAGVLYLSSERSEIAETVDHTAPLSIPFELDWNLIWIEGVVDSKQGFFILDTGAPTLILNSGGRKLGNSKLASAGGIGLGGEVEMQPHRVKSFQLGGVEQGAQPAYQIDLREIELRAGREIHGLVGYEQFNDYELLIDYPARRMKLYPNGKNTLHTSERPLQSVKFSRYTHLPLIRLQQGKRRLLFVLDTGAGASLLHHATATDLAAFPEPSGETNYLVGVDGNRQSAPIVRIPHLQLGTAGLANFPLVLTDLSHLSQIEGLAIDGVLGTDFLKTHRISIDYKRQRLHFWPLSHIEAVR